MTPHDHRLERGAYLTDGSELYEVIDLRIRPGVMGVRTIRVVMENCRDFAVLELLPDRLRAGFTLVRRAPAARCPDHVADIHWEAPAPRPIAIRSVSSARAAAPLN